MTAAISGVAREVRDGDPVAGGEARMRRDGVVLLESILDPATIDRCRLEVERTHALDLPAGHFRTSPGRSFGALPMQGALGDPAVFANPIVLALAEQLLGPEFVLDSFGIIVSLPGATDQGVHRDGRLFPDSPLDPMLPPFALTLAIPLVRMDEISGSTAFSTGSHRKIERDPQLDYVPIVPTGSALLWDYRTLHRGVANRGDRPRPVLFLVYCRSWWQDAGNFDYGRADKLLLARETRDALDARTQHLLWRAKLVD